MTMQRVKSKRKWRKTLTALLAAVLWIEGTLGTAYASEPAFREMPAVNAEQAAGEGETALTEGDGETLPSDTVEKPAEEENGNGQSVEEGEEAVSGSGDGSGEDFRNPEDGETAPGEEDGSDGELPQEPVETEKPEEGEQPAPGEEKPDGEETDGPEKPEEEENDASVERPEVSENTVSENTATDEIPADWSGEPTLGEPPLMTEPADGAAAYSYYSISPMAAGIRRQTPGVGDIIDRYRAYPWSLDVSNSYSVEPSVKDPYKAGHLSDESLENALNLLNFIRYVAGVPADVTLSEDYTEKAQAGALLNRVNGKVDYKPVKPDSFPDGLYQTGYQGCVRGNLAAGYGNLAKSLLNGWVFDGASSNIDRMAHRRWVLNPAMAETGFGAVGSYAAMYAQDSSGSSITDYVAWPAQNMPIELMNGSGTPWTLSLGSDYEKASFQDVTVTLRDISNNKSWTFSGSKANGVFRVNIEYYGMHNCIIFRPNDVSYNKNSQFQVTVSGIRLKDGAEGKDTTISYNVDFFSLEEEPAEVSEIAFNKESLHLLKGVEGKQEETLLATVTPGNARDKRLVWTSKDEKVAVVDGTGRVTAVGEGETEISAKSANGVQAVCTVKVSDYTLQSDAAGFTFDEETNTYGLAFDLTMNAKPGRLVVMDGDPAGGGGEATDSVRWISENESVAEVNQAGYVTPVAVGETLVWAQVDDGLAVLACRVKVEDSKLPQIEMRENTCTLTIKRDAAGNLLRESRQLRLYFSPTDSKWVNRGENYVKWTTGDPAVAAFAAGQTGGTLGEETEPGVEEGSGTETKPVTAAETISGNTVTVTAVGAGETEISAVIVDETGEPVTDSDGKRAETSCTVTVQAEAEPADSDMPRPVVLTNTQTKLRDVALPEGWSWKEPDTALAQFAGGKTKKFAALYKPSDAGEHILPAERLLEVCFLTLESVSISMQTEEGKEQENAALAIGQNATCYVNYSFDEALELLANSGDYKNNVWFRKQKEEILKELEGVTAWSNSRPDVVSVERTADGVKLSAKSVGSSTVKASLKLGRKTFSASVKLTVKEAGGVLTVKEVEHFTRVGGADSGTGQTEEKYAGLLVDFQTEKANQVNSKITLTLPGATKVTAKSGNAKVVTVKSAAAEEDGFVVSLIVKAAGTAELTLTGNDAAKTTRTIRLVVGDAEPGLSDESLTVNLQKSTGTGISLIPARSPEGKEYKITYATLGSDEKSAKFTMTKGTLADSYIIKARSGTKTGTYKVKIRAAAEGTTYDLPLTVKVVSKNPVYKVKQARKLNLFYKNDESLLQIDTDETLTRLECTGLADYSIEKRDGCYYIRAEKGATLKSVKKGNLKLYFSGWQGSYATSFTASVEKKAPKLTWDTAKVTLYPQAGIQSMWIGIKNPEAISWASVHVEKSSGKAKGNYTLEVDREKGGLLLSGKNLNQADSFKMQILLSDTEKWAEKETVSHTLQVKVNMGQPAIALENKTLQLNADAAYRGYDAAATAVKWKEGGALSTDQGVRVSVYCDPKDAKAKALVQNSQVVFSVKNAQVSVRLNNKAVNTGTYKYIVQAAKNGQIWKTPLTLKVVNTAPEKAVKMTAKGSIDVLNRDGSFMTLTPSLKAVSGEFVISESREVKLTGRDAHLFRAGWSEDGKTIELRAKRNETLVTKYQYTVTPLLTLRNINGETEEIAAPAVKFKLKQGSVKVTALPQTGLMYSGAYNSVEIDMNAVLKGADAPEIEKVVLTGNTDAFSYVYNKDGKGTLTMKDTGRAVKGKSYSLQFKVSFAEQADNMKPVTVRCKVKVK
ncbi:MAG: Ig-like domain-containing protein [Lachnospiraceae bacterium]|nr:Ig-like domain-containing protein [Lachnospiraceae bacterium]